MKKKKKSQLSLTGAWVLYFTTKLKANTYVDTGLALLVLSKVQFGMIGEKRKEMIVVSHHLFLMSKKAKHVR